MPLLSMLLGFLRISCHCVNVEREKYAPLHTQLICSITHRLFKMPDWIAGRFLIIRKNPKYVIAMADFLVPLASIRQDHLIKRKHFTYALFKSSISL
jgi:hypothetical protein